MVTTNSLNAPVTNNTLLRGNGSGFSVISAANNSTLVTSGTGVPSLSTTLPTIVQGNITTLGQNVQISTANSGATSQIALTNTATTNFSSARMVVQTSTNSSTQSYAFFWAINNFSGISFGCNSTQDSYYIWRGSPLSGNVVASWDVNNLFSNAGAISCGTGGVVGGTIQLNGSTSQSVTLNPSANAGDWFFNFPDNPGTAGQALLSDGGSGGMTWGTLSSTLPWTDEGTTFTASVANAYFITATITANLPTSPAQGDTIEFTVDAAAVLTIQAATGQTIRISSSVSTTAGTATSAAQGDSVTLVYRSSSSSWVASSVIGIWTTA